MVYRPFLSSDLAGHRPFEQDLDDSFVRRNFSVDRPAHYTTWHLTALYHVALMFDEPLSTSPASTMVKVFQTQPFVTGSRSNSGAVDVPGW